MGEAPVILGAAERDRGKSGDFQRTKRLLAASVDGSGEGESPAPAPAGVREKHKKAPGVCVLSPWQPRLHHRHGSQGRPGQNTLLWEMESSGQAQQHPRYMGVTFGECHSRLTGWSGTQGRAGDSLWPGSTECVALL